MTPTIPANQIGTPSERNELRFWRGFFLLAGLQSLLALSLLLRGMSETGSRLIFGLSLARLGLGAIILALLVVFGTLLAVSWITPGWTRKQIARVRHLRNRPRLLGSLILLFGVGLFFGAYAASLTPEVSEPFAAAIFQRILPLVLLGAGLSAQALLALLLVRSKVNFTEQLKGQGIFWGGVILFCLFFVGWGWVVRHTMPVKSAITGWNDLGTPLLETQVILAWLIGMLVWGLIALGQAGGARKLNPRVVDGLICLVIWFGTILLWNSTPAPSSYFLTEPRAPNYQAYPNSDALVYDMSAQVLLNGEGLRFANDIYVRRPMLALFFTVLHVLGGQQAAVIYFWQIVFLAAAPVVLYLLGKSLHSRLAGVIGAILLALRGANAILLSNAITTSHVKVLMADLPAALAMLIFVYVSVRWMQTRSQILGILAGGMLGLAVLIRPETGAALFAVGLISFLVFQKERRKWLLQLLLFFVGLLLVLSPWIYRNWSLTGLIFLDTPSFRTDWLQNRYNITPQPTPTPQPASAVLWVSPKAAETGLQFAARSHVQPILALPKPRNALMSAQSDLGSAKTGQNPTVAQVTATPSPAPDRPDVGGMLSALQQSSGDLPKVFLSHYLNSQIQIFLTLPTTFRPLDSLVGYAGHHSLERLWSECCSIEGYYRRLPYWRKWNGDIPSQTVTLLLINLSLLALGIQQSWKQAQINGEYPVGNSRGWVGLLPLSVGVVHLLINSLARNSGGRYILPIDWIGVLYFSFGLATASVWVVNMFTRKKLPVELIEAIQPPVTPVRQKKLLRTPQFWLAAVFLLLLGSAAPLLEIAIPARFTEESQAQMIAKLLASPDLGAEQKQALTDLLNSDGIAVVGRAYYPRHFGAREGRGDFRGSP